MAVDYFTIEEWRPINGTPNYEVSSFGNVRNAKPRFKNQGNLRLINNGIGYLRACLVIEGKKRYRYIHRLVAEAFLCPIKGRPQVNHKDCDKSHNHVGNLEYMTSAENLQHARQAGKQIGRIPALTPAEVKIVRVQLGNGITPSDIARRFNVQPSTIWQIKHNRTYKWVE